ncbi:MAG: CCA tRNA nucleotidyltransferase [Clostridia bacterium]|nr:CCA tRNA nucleotidyltransferase [Clostridia bacterium]
MKIPAGVAAVLERLELAGREGYLVGGCVRDHVMGCTPHDYDVTTSALPEETLAIFRGDRVIETGLQHGTVTVLTADGPVEVTTYRQDGTYSDHRHPDGVTFTRSLREDLARRDFTMNAMAMGRSGALEDPFGGREDIQRGLIRCVGEADRRFEEDALRILRGLRFAARLGFALEEETAAAMDRKKELLNTIARERVFSELCGLLQGVYAPEILAQYRAVVQSTLPELDLSRCELLKALPPEPALRLAALLQREQAPGLLTRLKVSNEFRRTVLMLVEEREQLCPPERKAVRRRCAALGAENFLLLCRYQQNERARQIAEALIREKACLSIGDLAVNGRDLMGLGLRGAAIGRALEQLLEQVTEENIPNEKEALLQYLKQ